MPLSESILNLPGYEIEWISGRDPILMRVRHRGVFRCPFCGRSRLRLKGSYVRRVRHESFGKRAVFLLLQGKKHLCLECGRYFNQRFPGILPYKRSTERFRKEVFEKHLDGICQSRLSSRLEMGSATVERWYHDFLHRKVQELSGAPCPRELGIDEHFFTRKAGYATTLCDLSGRRVYDVVLGRSGERLERYLRNLEGRQYVRYVVMDLAESYRNVVRKHFPWAKIVSDRFHVIRLINLHFLRLWGKIDPVGRKNRGLISLMRRRAQKLSDLQKQRLSDYFDQFPAIAPIYDFKEKLCKLMRIKHRTRKQCRKIIPKFLAYIEELKHSGLEQMIVLGNTLDAWKEEIVRMWRYTKTNSITEGFHNKMEMISRRAYGFRNFENYRLRVKALCA